MADAATVRPAPFLGPRANDGSDLVNSQMRGTKQNSREPSPNSAHNSDVHLTTLQPAKGKLTACGSGYQNSAVSNCQTSISPSACGNPTSHSEEQLQASQAKDTEKRADKQMTHADYRVQPVKPSQPAANSRCNNPYPSYQGDLPYPESSVFPGQSFHPSSHTAFDHHLVAPERNESSSYPLSSHLPLPPVPSFLHGSSQPSFHRHYDPPSSSSSSSTPSSANRYSPSQTPRSGGLSGSPYTDSHDDRRVLKLLSLL